LKHRSGEYDRNVIASTLYFNVAAVLIEIID
jgi:hypothetical protein